MADGHLWFPKHIFFGTNCWTKLTSEEIQGSVLVIARRAMTNPVADYIYDHLKEGRVAIVISEPMLSQVESDVNWLSDMNLKTVIGMGGGSAMDVAKYIGMRLKLEIITIPTLAGSGSEVTAEAVLKDDKGRKKAFIEEGLLPDQVYIDPLIQGLAPVKRQYLSMVDALVASAEVAMNPRVSRPCKVFAERAMSLILPQYHETNFDVEALAEASMLAGFAFGNTGTGIIHAISYVLGQWGLPHSTAIAMAAEAATELVHPDILRFICEENAHYGIHVCPERPVWESDIQAGINEILQDTRHLSNHPGPVAEEDLGRIFFRIQESWS